MNCGILQVACFQVFLFFLLLSKLVLLSVVIFIHLLPDKNTFYRVIGFDAHGSQPGIYIQTCLLIHTRCKLLLVKQVVHHWFRLFVPLYVSNTVSKPLS